MIDDPADGTGLIGIQRLESEKVEGQGVTFIDSAAFLVPLGIAFVLCVCGCSAS